MSPDSTRDLMIFTEALGLAAGARADFLDRACGGDQKLRAKVEALLRANDRVGGFLEEPPTGIAVEGIRGTPTIEKPGDRIGRYKLLQQIGEGGWGTVFMAEQEEPVRRRVALKIVKPGMDTKSVVARFEAERQALAMMDHPNIAHVLDAGATQNGRPFFVMELVRGTKITEYCDRNSLTTCERLELFIKVCDAVQHAHQKGIIHRDIKPSNILVATDADGKALPKVIDFGIAKATTNQPLTDKTLFTAFEMLIGTPAYMSPEQATLTSIDVDTRTDIYSLGVLLYELLTSTTPFDSHELLKAGIDEIRRVISSEEPVRPSTRLHTMLAADLTSVSQRQRADPSKLISDVRGDLDWIVMKALEKNRARRYATAHGMALDVQRYLANEPIAARPPGKLYLVQKTVLRNKLLFTGIGVITLLLVVSLIVVSASLAKERQARREADAASLKSQQFAKFLKEMFNGIGPSKARGRDTAIVREILDATAAHIGKDLNDQPSVEADIRTLLGNLYDQIGRFDQAEDMERAALAIRRKLFNPGSPELAASLHDLGVELTAQQKYTEAEQVDVQALAIRRRLYGDENEDTATSLNDLSGVYRDQRKLPEAEAMALEALQIRRKLFTNDNSNIADSLRTLCLIKGYEGNWAEAEKIGRDFLGMQQRLLGPEHPYVAGALHDVAWAAHGRRELAEAEKLEAQALAIRQKYLPDEHPDIGKTFNSRRLHHLKRLIIRRFCFLWPLASPVSEGFLNYLALSLGAYSGLSWDE